MPSPMTLTLRRLRAIGYLADTVERWLPHANVRRDLFGFGDVLAVHRRDAVILIVQTTSGGHVGDRLKKAKARPELKLWLKAGGSFEVHGWKKRGDRWQLKVVEVKAADLAEVTVTAPVRRRRRDRQRGLFD